MKDWKETILEQYIIVTNGYAFKSVNFSESKSLDNLPVIKIKNVANGDVNLEKVQFHAYEESLSKFLITNGDILIALTGNHPDAMSQVVGGISKYKLKETALLNQRVAKIEGQKTLNNNFLYYFMKEEDTKDYLANQSSGSANQANISKKDIENIPILLPPLLEQEAIAEVLSSIDDKIDLLHRQNATFEVLAETLFRQWFIEDAKEDWEEITLDKWVNIINGISYKSEELKPSNVAMITLKSFHRNGGFRLDGFKEFVGSYKEKHIISEGDLIVAHTDLTQNLDLIGSPALVSFDSKYEEFIFSMDLVKVESKFSYIKNEFLYLLMKSKEFKEHAIGYSNGSTVIHLSKRAIPEFEFKEPPLVIINEFNLIILPFFRKRRNNVNQIQTLTKLRDTLLPKLISGEVRVKM